jgi:hypothetical protein
MSLYNRPVGWRGESYRHYLAGKGIASKNKYFMAFYRQPRRGSWSEWSDHSQDGGDAHSTAYRKWDVELEEMSPKEFLELTRKAAEVSDGRIRTKEEFERIARSDATKNRREYIAKGILAKEDVVPLPFYEVDADGILLGTQEGRTRAIVAEELGMDKIPVAKFMRRTAAQKRRDAGEEELPRWLSLAANDDAEGKYFAKKIVREDTPFVTFYHGTSEDAKEKILRDGLKPGKFGMSFGSVDASVAKEYADEMVSHKEADKGAVVRVTVPRDKIIMVPFPSSHLENAGIEGDVPPERIRELKGDDLKKKVAKHLRDKELYWKGRDAEESLPTGWFTKKGYFNAGVPFEEERRKRCESEGKEYFAKKVDLKKYSGTWRQESIKNEPWFQKGCEDVTAKYTFQKDGTVKVVNSCDGRKVEANARSVSKDNRRLKVDFGFPFGEGDYVIKSVNPSYTRAVVKGGKTEWTLVR